MPDCLDNEKSHSITKLHKKKKKKSAANEGDHSTSENHNKEEKRKSGADEGDHTFSEPRKKKKKSRHVEGSDGVKMEAHSCDSEVDRSSFSQIAQSGQSLTVPKMKRKKKREKDRTDAECASSKNSKKRPLEGHTTKENQKSTANTEHAIKVSEEIIMDGKGHIANLSDDDAVIAHSLSSSGKKKKKRKRSRESSLNKKTKKVFHSLLTENPYAENKIIKESEDAEQNAEDPDKPTKKKEPKRKKKKTVQVETGDPHKPDETKPDTTKLGIAYLRTWKTDKANWHFQKSRQLWLIRNIYNNEAIDNDNFSCLLEYLEGSKGGVRTRLLENAQAIHNSIDGESEDSSDAVKVNRAKEILQMLSE